MKLIDPADVLGIQGGKRPIIPDADENAASRGVQESHDLSGGLLRISQISFELSPAVFSQPYFAQSLIDVHLIATLYGTAVIPCTSENYLDLAKTLPHILNRKPLGIDPGIVAEELRDLFATWR